jgi:hypothetical protein
MNTEAIFDSLLKVTSDNLKLTVKSTKRKLDKRQSILTARILPVEARQTVNTARESDW